MENTNTNQQENSREITEKSEREWNKLSCLRLAKGDLRKAESYYQWVTSK